MSEQIKTAEAEILDLFKKHFEKFRYNPFYGSADHFMKHGSVTGNLAAEAIAFANSVASLRVEKLQDEIIKRDSEIARLKKALFTLFEQVATSDGEPWLEIEKNLHYKGRQRLRRICKETHVILNPKDNV